MRVLVSASLQEFYLAQRAQREQRDAERSLQVEFFERGEIPSGSFDGILPIVTDRVGAAEIDRLSGLRIIANFGVGYDNIDVAHARERGIVVANTPGVLTAATAELTWALILAAARRVGEGERMVRAGEWTGWMPTQLRGMSLDGKVLGIVGAGRIGREVARRAAAFGMDVIHWSRTRAPDIPYVELDDLLARADVVSIHLARSAETENLIDARRLRLMRDGAILINTARGSIVDENALIAELVSGRLRAGLDVYAREPSVPVDLLSLENVVLLPHLGSATYEARQAMWDLAWANLVTFLLKGTLISPVLDPGPGPGPQVR